MRDVHLVALAAERHNRFSWRQAYALGLSETGLRHRLHAGRIVRVYDGVFAMAPVLDDDKGRWMGAALTAPGTALSHASAAAAGGFWSLPRDVETVTRPGDGGPRMIDGLLIFRSRTLGPWMTTRWGIPMTTPARTLLDLAPVLSVRALKRCVREAVRLERTSIAEIVDVIAAHPGRRGTLKLLAVTEGYAALPLRRARSGAEVRGLELLRAHGHPMPRLNYRIAGEEADLSWPTFRVIVEIDGGPFHLDRGEDARKEAIWRAAGWEVRRCSSDDVYDAPHRFLALTPNVQEHPV